MYGEIVSFLEKRNYDVFEKKYVDKVPQNLEISTEFEKEVTEAITYKYEVSIKITNFKKLDTTIDGEKKELIKGQFEISIKPTITIDFEKHLKELKGPLSFLRKFFMKIMTNTIINKYVGPLVGESQSLIKRVRQVLEKEL